MADELKRIGDLASPVRLPTGEALRADLAAPPLTKADLVTAAARLVEGSVAANDSAIEHRLAQVIGGRPRFEIVMRYPNEGEVRALVVSVHRPPGITAEGIAKARRLMAQAMAPLPPADILKAITRVMLSTAKRASDATDTRAQGAVYADHLSGYPADVALEALYHPWHFWPTWGELHERCERMVCRRRAVKLAVDAWQPWSAADERAHLATCARHADGLAWDRRYTDPDGSSEAAEAAAAFRGQLAEMG